ncbi:hypothetical protein NDN08_002147 [Rhodosorus marinus]|uniref:Uncharacterized protein n=1 Tax=Rhodosorus marinus TaxID=101924 RepID=A0AAV8UVT6_9RHOD|nr:hypothetical protein NDN08_002147 [Rhodosorus marinus]
MRGYGFFWAVIVAVAAVVVDGEVKDFLLTFSDEGKILPHLVDVWTLPDGNFAGVSRGIAGSRPPKSRCTYFVQGRDTLRALVKNRIRWNGCERVATSEEGGFVAKGYESGGLDPIEEYAKAFPQQKDEFKDFAGGLITRYSSTGSSLWYAPFVHHQDDSVGDVVVLRDGSVVSDDYLPVKYSADGKPLFEMPAVIPRNYDVPRGGGILEVENESVIIAVNDSENRVAVAKYNIRGEKVWLRYLSRGCRAARNLRPALSTAGNYYIGCTTGYSEISPGGGKVKAGAYRIYTLSPEGVHLLERTVQTSGDETLQSIVAEEDGGLLLVGSSDSPKGGDKMAEGTGSWFVKVSENGLVEWDFVSPYGDCARRSSRGYLTHTYLGTSIHELVTADFREPKDIETGQDVNPGDTIAIQVVKNKFYIAVANGVKADSNTTDISAQWMVVSAIPEQAASSGSEGSIVLPARKPAWSPQLGSPTLRRGVEKYGYLRLAWQERIEAKIRKSAASKMKVSRIRSGYPSMGSEVVIRDSFQNKLWETTPKYSEIVAERETFPLQGFRDRFVFQVLPEEGTSFEGGPIIDKGLVILKAKAGMYLVASGTSLETNRIFAIATPWQATHFEVTITTNGYTILTPVNTKGNAGCLMVSAKGQVEAEGSRKKTSRCELMLIPV